MQVIVSQGQLSPYGPLKTRWVKWDNTEQLFKYNGGYV